MKIALAAIVALIVGFVAGDYIGKSAAKPLPSQQVVENTTLENLTNTILSLRAQVADRDEKIQKLIPIAQRAVTLPVKLSKRKALLSAGYVYALENHSGKELRLTVTIENGSASRRFSYVVGTLVPKEIEGWAGADGDKITIESEGYEPAVFTY